LSKVKEVSSVYWSFLFFNQFSNLYLILFTSI